MATAEDGPEFEFLLVRKSVFIRENPWSTKTSRVIRENRRSRKPQIAQEFADARNLKLET